MVGVVAALAALDEPGVLVRGVVDHKVHEHAQAAVVGLLQNALEDLEVAEVRVDVHVVGDVVAPVRVRGGVERREPDRIHAQTLDVVEPVQNAVEIADPVAVAVAEAPGPDVVDHHILIPGSKRHEVPLLLKSLFFILPQPQCGCGKICHVFRLPRKRRGKRLELNKISALHLFYHMRGQLQQNTEVFLGTKPTCRAS